jgi:hypothetical protein
MTCRVYAGLRDWKWKGFFLNQQVYELIILKAC